MDIAELQAEFDIVLKNIDQAYQYKGQIAEEHAKRISVVSKKPNKD